MEDEQEVSPVRVKREVIWQNVLLYIYLHMSALYGMFLIFSQAQFATALFSKLYFIYFIEVAELNYLLGRVMKEIADWVKISLLNNRYETCSILMNFCYRVLLRRSS